jgi:hypothetical protein
VPPEIFFDKNLKLLEKIVKNVKHRLRTMVNIKQLKKLSSPQPIIELKFPMTCKNWLELNTWVLLDPTLPPHHEAGCSSGPRELHHDHHHVLTPESRDTSWYGPDSCRDNSAMHPCTGSCDAVGQSRRSGQRMCACPRALVRQGIDGNQACERVQEPAEGLRSRGAGRSCSLGTARASADASDWL